MGLSFGTVAFLGSKSMMGGCVSGNRMFHWLSMAESKRTLLFPPSAPAPAPVLACLEYGTSDHTSMGHKMSSFGPHMCGLIERAVLHSDSTLTFSPTSSLTYSAPETWDTPPSSPTVVSEFPNVVPAHPFDILLCLASKPFSLGSLM